MKTSKQIVENANNKNEISYKLLKRFIRNENVVALVDWLFGFKVVPGQEKIIREIIFNRNPRLVISAHTRYGKTRAVSISILLYVLLNRNETIAVIAPKLDQARKIRGYVGEHIVDSPIFQRLVEVNVSGVGRLKKEVSKRKVTFNNGCELNILTAGGDLLGEGAGGLLVLDEVENIDYDKYTSEIRRMLGDSPNSQEIMLGNPTHKENQFYDAWEDPNYTNIKIDYEQGLEEGRIDKSFLEEQRNKLSDREFKVYYKSEFPETTEDSLFKYKWIEESFETDINPIKDAKIVYGLDVAGEGEDKTVLSKLKTWNVQGIQFYKVSNLWTWDLGNTKEQVKRIRSILAKGSRINVDAIGMGKNVADDLDSMGFDVREVKVSQKPISEQDRFNSLKAEGYWKFRNILEDERIDLPKHKQLQKELTGIEYEFTRRGKIKIIDPSKSPDHSDSIVFALLENVGGRGRVTFGSIER